MQSKDILNGFTTTDLLDALAARGLDARDLYHRLEELVVYVHDEEQEKDAPWPSEYQEGEASLRAWENAKARAEADDAKRGDAQVVAGAIDLVQAARFSLGRAPTYDDERSLVDGMQFARDAHRSAVMMGLGSREARMGSFQRAGLVAGYVALALRFGFLKVRNAAE